MTKKPRFGVDAQIERLREMAKQHEKAACEAHKDVERILASIERRRNEPEDVVSKNLRRYRSVKGMREVRYRLTGERRKSATQEGLAYRAFEYIAKEWKRSRAGFDGVPISVRQLKNHLGVSERQVYRILDSLDGEHEVLIHLKRPGDVTRYALTLPETDAYFEMLEHIFALSAERIRQQLEYEEICLDQAA